MRGVRALSGAMQQPGRSATWSRRELSYFSGRSLHTMGLGYLRFMQRGASSPVDRCIATPAFRPSRRGVALFCGRVIRARIILRSKAAKHSAKDGANRFPSLSMISSLRHVQEHGEAGEQRRAEVLQGVASGND
jgi:hypothetical protein